MWQIPSLLKQHGVPVRMLRSANPGKVLYEDSFQIVVEEWKEIPAPSNKINKLGGANGTPNLRSSAKAINSTSYWTLNGR